MTISEEGVISTNLNLQAAGNESAKKFRRPSILYTFWAIKQFHFSFHCLNL
jgi:hypothetical protein